jgi:cytochrome d ubiquinol oxidase subunit I
MSDPLLWHRLQFAFTIVYHYLFPQLTMGLALLIVVLKARGLSSGQAQWDTAARFWIRIFGINFAVGVVTGIPMEFQFGTNWARFSEIAGGVVGQTLAMEGMFAFFLESTFLGLLVFGERRLGRRGHFLAAVALFLGSWLSGYFIVATNAFMQHPVGHQIGPDGHLHLASFWTFVLNPWARAQYAHTMVAAVVTASFVMLAVGAYYALQKTHLEQARIFLRVGVVAGLVSSVLVAFPTGDLQAKLVVAHQPVALAAMEGRFESGGMAEINVIGQPNVRERKLDNPIRIPGMLSWLAYGQFHSNVRGLNEFPEDTWPDNIELLYYAFHVMAGLGTLFILFLAIATVVLWRGRLEQSRALLWMLMLAFPFPYIANTAGWMTTELGRQPWLVYGILRTADGASPLVHAGTALFTLIGFCGLYFVLGVLFLYLIGREVAHGPTDLDGLTAAPRHPAEVPRG